MDKCQVVNMGPDGQPASVKQPVAPISTNTTTSASSAGPSKNTGAPLPPRMSDREIEALEELYNKVDDEFQELNQHSNNAVSQKNAAFSDDMIMKQLKVFGMGTDCAGMTQWGSGLAGLMSESNSAAPPRHSTEKRETASVNDNTPNTAQSTFVSKASVNSEKNIPTQNIAIKCRNKKLDVNAQVLQCVYFWW